MERNHATLTRPISGVSPSSQRGPLIPDGSDKFGSKLPQKGMLSLNPVFSN